MVRADAGSHGTGSAKFVRPGGYQVWVGAEDTVGNTAITGPHQVERLGFETWVYLPLVVGNWDSSQPILQNRVYPPLVIRHHYLADEVEER